MGSERLLNATTDELLGATYEYCQMMASHIPMEDSYLYPLARRMSPRVAIDELSVRFSGMVAANLSAFGDAATELEKMASSTAYPTHT